jgi:RNA polymerase sigma-70 factor, ECF subfamily
MWLAKSTTRNIPTDLPVLLSSVSFSVCLHLNVHKRRPQGGASYSCLRFWGDGVKESSGDGSALPWHAGPLKYPGVMSYTKTGKEKANMPFIKWALALADQTSQATALVGAVATVNSLADLDDRNLVLEAQAGNRAAFEELVQRYDRDVLRLAMNLMKRTEDARDVYQEAFLKVYRNLHRFRFECSFYTWLYRIVTNVCLDHLRRRKARPEDQAPELHPAKYEEGSTDFFERQKEHRPALDPEKHLVGQEIKARLATAMLRLSPRERIVFEMKHYQGLKLRAIGDALGTSEETVKNSLFRATRKLRQELSVLR